MNAALNWRSDGCGNYDALAAATQLAALTALTVLRLRDNTADDLGLRRLVTSPHFARLRRLELCGGMSARLLPPDWEPFLAGLALPLLEGLALVSWGAFAIGGLERARLPALRQLALSCCSPMAVADMCEELADGQVAPKLDYIVINGHILNHISEGIATLSAHAPPSLRALAVPSDRSVVTALAASRFATQLTRIELCYPMHSLLNAHACAALAAAPLSSLRVLVLEEAMPADAATALARAPWLGALSRLVFNDFDHSNTVKPYTWCDMLDALRASPAFRALEAAGRVTHELHPPRYRSGLRAEPALYSA